MCLLIERDKKPIILKEDLTVFKIIGFNTVNNLDIVEAPVYDFIYHRDVLYKQEMCDCDDYSGFDEIAQYVYLSDFDKDDYHKYVKSIGKGFHSALNIERFKCWNFMTYAELKIHKGSKIFQDKTGLIVSNQIIYKRTSDEKR